ncbi:MAG: DeoR/GlpR family DNA-binding transcription regulator [Oscillospiraceae bacterium]|nr:DeoR/GlpR family DNA-binding transcription regulator [Oscillospiraceae bacterium]
MTATERREKIVAMLQHTNFIKITDVVSQFEISNETVRRDLDYLQDQKLIRRVYGGAILKERTQTVPSHQSHLISELSAIGRAAADLVVPGESVFLCNGSTTLQVAHYLRSRSNITVVTNSLAIINELADSEVNLIILGGRLSSGERDISGDLTVDCVNRFYCDKAFFGCGGATMELGVMDYNSGSMPLHPYVIQRSAQHILVASSQKFGTPAFVTACSLDDVDLIISDTQLSEDYQTHLREHGIELLLVDAEPEASGKTDD